MSTFRGFRDALRAYIPIWLSQRPGLDVGYRILYTVALFADIALKFVIEGVYCWFPGYSLGAAPNQIDASTALPLVGRSRGILRGEADTDAGYAARLINWLTDWEAAGSSEILLQQIQAYLGNTPLVRIFDRAGNAISIDSSGHITEDVASWWNWDEVSNPDRVNWWSDLWIVIYPCEWAITGSTLSTLVGIWGTPASYTAAAVGTGHAVPRAAVDAILGIVEQWKGAHVWVEAIIWSYDSTLFVPASPTTDDPSHGTWGDWGYYDWSTSTFKPARTSDTRVRYWVPDGG